MPARLRIDAGEQLVKFCCGRVTKSLELSHVLHLMLANLTICSILAQKHELAFVIFARPVLERMHLATRDAPVSGA